MVCGVYHHKNCKMEGVWTLGCAVRCACQNMLFEFPTLKIGWMSFPHIKAKLPKFPKKCQNAPCWHFPNDPERYAVPHAVIRCYTRCGARCSCSLLHLILHPLTTLHLVLHLAPHQLINQVLHLVPHVVLPLVLQLVLYLVLPLVLHLV